MISDAVRERRIQARSKSTKILTDHDKSHRQKREYEHHFRRNKSLMVDREF